MKVAHVMKIQSSTMKMISSRGLRGSHIFRVKINVLLATPAAVAVLEIRDCLACDPQTLPMIIRVRFQYEINL